MFIGLDVVAVEATAMFWLCSVSAVVRTRALDVLSSVRALAKTYKQLKAAFVKYDNNSSTSSAATAAGGAAGLASPFQEASKSEAAESKRKERELTAQFAELKSSQTDLRSRRADMMASVRSRSKSPSKHATITAVPSSPVAASAPSASVPAESIFSNRALFIEHTLCKGYTHVIAIIEHVEAQLLHHMQQNTTNSGGHHSSGAGGHSRIGAHLNSVLPLSFALSGSLLMAPLPLSAAAQLLSSSAAAANSSNSTSGGVGGSGSGGDESFESDEDWMFAMEKKWREWEEGKTAEDVQKMREMRRNREHEIRK